MTKLAENGRKGFNAFCDICWLLADTQMMQNNFVSYATFSAVAELYILGHGKHCVITTRSTYSLAMCALTGKRPIIIEPKENICDTETYSDLILFRVLLNN